MHVAHFHYFGVGFSAVAVKLTWEGGPGGFITESPTLAAHTF